MERKRPPVDESWKVQYRGKLKTGVHVAQEMSWCGFLLSLALRAVGTCQKPRTPSRRGVFVFAVWTAEGSLCFMGWSHTRLVDWSQQSKPEKMKKLLTTGILWPQQLVGSSSSFCLQQSNSAISEQARLQGDMTSYLRWKLSFQFLSLPRRDWTNTLETTSSKQVWQFHTVSCFVWKTTASFTSGWTWRRKIEHERRQLTQLKPRGGRDMADVGFSSLD